MSLSRQKILNTSQGTLTGKGQEQQRSLQQEKLGGAQILGQKLFAPCPFSCFLFVSAKITGVCFIPRRNEGPKKMPPTIAPGTTWWHQYPKMIECILLLILHWKPQTQRSSANLQVQFFFHGYLSSSRNFTPSFISIYEDTENQKMKIFYFNITYFKIFFACIYT